MNASDWIHLSEKDLSVEKTKGSVGGVQVQLVVSPYDVPDAVRALVDEDLNRLVIEFRYIAEEPLEWKSSESVSVALGKNSGRILKIALDLNTLPDKHRVDFIWHAIDALGADAKDVKRRPDNLRLTRGVLESKQKALLSATG